MCNCIRQNVKSTMKAYNTVSQTLATGTNIEFANFIESGTAIIPSGSVGLKIHKAGKYLVSFNANAVENGTAGDITANLYLNGTTVPEARASEHSFDVTSVVNLSFTTVIDVKNSCGCIDNTTVLTVQNDGIGAIYRNAVLTVVKL